MSPRRRVVPVADLGPLEGRTLDVMSHTIYDQTGTLVAAVFPPTEADTARRLVACWNACRGIPTNDIERGQIAITRVAVNVEINHGTISVTG